MDENTNKNNGTEKDTEKPAAKDAQINGTDLQQAKIQPERDIDALQKSYRELQAEFTRKSQALAELEIKYNSAPKRDEIIREYLISTVGEQKPAVLTSSGTDFDLAKEKKPTDIYEADKLARKYFMQK
jgi:hypothetical protein